MGAESRSKKERNKSMERKRKMNDNDRDLQSPISLPSSISSANQYTRRWWCWAEMVEERKESSQHFFLSTSTRTIPIWAHYTSLVATSSWMLNILIESSLQSPQLNGQHANLSLSSLFWISKLISFWIIWAGYSQQLPGYELRHFCIFFFACLPACAISWRHVTEDQWSEKNASWAAV